MVEDIGLRAQYEIKQAYGIRNVQEMPVLSQEEASFADQVGSIPGRNGSGPDNNAVFQFFMGEKIEARNLLRRLKFGFIQEQAMRGTVIYDAETGEELRDTYEGRITKRKHNLTGYTYSDWRIAPRPNVCPEILSNYIGKWNGDELESLPSESLTFVAVDPTDEKALAVLCADRQSLPLAYMARFV
ncbi:MAG: hypothetical protein NUV73_03845 [Candidatus Daviesbacteria bacterium]|nr:hypothetical protein [Candidatus Daviesbacteria bacterium]